MYLTVRVLMRRRETYVGKDVSLPCMCSMDVRTIFVYLPAYLPTYLSGVQYILYLVIMKG